MGASEFRKLMLNVMNHIHPSRKVIEISRAYQGILFQNIFQAEIFIGHSENE